MSISTEVETVENAQQNEEQEIVAQNNEPPVLDTEDNNQESKFDFEKSKAQLEYISIVFALISVISTVLVKFLSLGTYLQFDFDINNCEFKLTNTDIIILFLSVLFCIVAILFCYKTNNIRNKISIKINGCFDGKFSVINLLKAIGWCAAYCSLLCSYPFLGYFIIKLLCSQRGIAQFQFELWIIFTYTFLFVFSLSCFTLVEREKIKYIRKVLSVVLIIITGLGLIKINYEGAVNKREFEIIIAENSEGQVQEYVVISKGSSYSTYQCTMEKQDLIIHTDLHCFFPIDGTETKLKNFDGYHLYKYGKPLEASNDKE